MYEYLFVLFKPSVHRFKVNRNQPIQFSFQMLSHGSFCSSVSDGNVVKLVLPRGERLGEVFLRQIFRFEEIVRILGLYPSRKVTDISIERITMNVEWTYTSRASVVSMMYCPPKSTLTRFGDDSM